MKDFLPTSYTFTPGASGVGTISLAIANFDPKRLVAIINQTRGAVIYATGSTDTRYTAISDNLLTLNVDTSTHSASDTIQVIYNSELPLEVVASNTDQTVGLLKILVDLLYSNAITDAGQRQRIVIDSISGGLTLSTVSSVTNVAGIFGVNQQMYMDMLHMQYDSGIRDRITL